MDSWKRCRCEVAKAKKELPRHERWLRGGNRYEGEEKWWRHEKW
jgi:hypothetical protein